MRILYISNEYPPETGFGGIATYTRNMARGMSGLGHDVHVICRSVSEAPVSEQDGRVSVHRTGPGSYPLPKSDSFYFFRKVCCRIVPHSLVRLAWAKEAYDSFVRIAGTIGAFDIVEYPECGGEGYYFKKDTKSVSIARLHTPWELVASLDGISENPVERMLLRHLDRSPVRAAHAVSCPTHSLAEMVNKKWRLGTITVFPNPIPSDEYPLSIGKDWIYTGRVERRKGVHVLIQAYANLCKTSTPPLLRIIGRPYGSQNGIEYGDLIERLIKSNNLSGSIEWIRGTDHESVKRYLAQSSVAIFPSLWENLSYGCCEAMACGCAVVASRCGGFTEIIHDGENGLLFSPEDSFELAQQLEKLNTQPDIARSLGAAARATIRKTCDTDIVCRRAHEWYQTVCDRGRAWEH
jgi:glycogen(starch) synthase